MQRIKSHLRKDPFMGYLYGSGLASSMASRCRWWNTSEGETIPSILASANLHGLRGSPWDAYPSIQLTLLLPLLTLLKLLRSKTE